jgi:hypothetical protein
MATVIWMLATRSGLSPAPAAEPVVERLAAGEIKLPRLDQQL